MTNEELNITLYRRLADEQDKFRQWLLSQPAEEILHHCYEYTVREDIVLDMEEHELSSKQCRALLKSPTPLADIYHDFEKLETGYMETVRDTIESRANKIIREDFLRRQRDAR